MNEGKEINLEYLSRIDDNGNDRFEIGFYSSVYVASQRRFKSHLKYPIILLFVLFTILPQLKIILTV